MTNKLYADGKGPSYTYTPDGELDTKLGQGRDDYIPLHKYDGGTRGNDYDDPLPRLLLLRPSWAAGPMTDGQGTRSFAYRPYLALTNESSAASRSS